MIIGGTKYENIWGHFHIFSFLVIYFLFWSFILFFRHLFFLFVIYFVTYLFILSFFDQKRKYMGSFHLFCFLVIYIFILCHIFLSVGIYIYNFFNYFLNFFGNFFWVSSRNIDVRMCCKYY